MLAKEIVDEFGEDAVYRSEIFGDSKLQKKHEIKRYPALFVNGQIFALPGDLGFGDEGTRRYMPWPSEESAEKLKKDLRQAISQELAGDSWSYESLAVK